VNLLKAELTRRPTREEVAGMFMAMREHVSDLVRPLDEKLAHFAVQLVALRQEFNAHVTDRTIHHMHAPTRRAPAKRKPTRASGRSR
jgi:hypothetical protein